MEQGNITKIFSNIYSHYLLITLVIIVVGLFLSAYEPPIKKQNQFVILTILSAALSWLTVERSVNSCLYGFVVAGLVFYKDRLLEEMKMLVRITTLQNQRCETSSEE